MLITLSRSWWAVMLAIPLGSAAVSAAESGYQQVIDGVAVYLGILPAQLVRGHPPQHPEGEMHGGAPPGENHIVVALFDAKSGARLVGVEVTARLTGDRGLDVRKRLEPMVIAGAASYGNYFYMPGAGPYRIELAIRLPGMHEEIRASFTWVRS